jgi:membrane-bound lytic murein transglycosylase D
MQLITTKSKYLLLIVMLLIILTPLQTVDVNERAAAPMNTISIEPIKATVSARSIWASIALNFKLDHQTDKAQVKAEIRKLLADQEKFHDILRASGPYLYFILKATQSYDLPGEIALIPFIESEFNPNDRSHKGATGLWQLMPQTARELGVKVKSGYDGRRNIVASTHAALTYFTDLAANFKGNWYLAIAAYNAGPGRVNSATKRGGTKVFWNLHLPRETKLYLPKLLAVAAILKNPDKYGIDLPPINNAPYFTEITVKKPVTLEKIAKTTDTTLTTLHKLNPDLKHNTMPQKNGDHKILLPVNATNTATLKKISA